MTCCGTTAEDLYLRDAYLDASRSDTIGCEVRSAPRPRVRWPTALVRRFAPLGCLDALLAHHTRVDRLRACQTCISTCLAARRLCQVCIHVPCCRASLHVDMHAKLHADMACRPCRRDLFGSRLYVPVNGVFGRRYPMRYRERARRRDRRGELQLAAAVRSCGSACAR